MSKKFRRTLILFVVLSLLVNLSGCTNEGRVKSKEGNNRLDEIIERGYIEVVMEPYFVPFQFIDPSKSGNDKYVGSDIEFAKYIADKLGVELRVVPLEFTAVLGGISEGKYDLAISALAYTPARADAMILSNGYYFAENTPGYGLLIREEDREEIKDSDDLSDKVVVIQSGSLQELLANEQIPKYKDLKRVSSTNDGLLMVQEKKADSCVVAKSMAQLYIDANTGCGLKIVDDFEFIVDKKLSGTRVGISLGEEKLEEKINEIIEEVLDSGIYKEWHDRYTDYAKNLGL